MPFGLIEATAVKSDAGGAVLVILILAIAVGGGIGYLIGNPKGRGGTGFVLGILLGFIGWIITACLSRTPEAEAKRMAAVQTSQWNSQALAHPPGWAPPPPLSATPAPDPDPTRVCPFCAERIKGAATLCRYCGQTVTPLGPVGSRTNPDSYAYMRGAHPRSFDQVWQEAGRYDTWPEPPMPAILKACIATEEGASPAEAVQNAFTAAQEPAAGPEG